MSKLENTVRKFFDITFFSGSLSTMTGFAYGGLTSTILYHKTAGHIREVHAANPELMQEMIEKSALPYLDHALPLIMGSFFAATFIYHQYIKNKSIYIFSNPEQDSFL